MKINLNYFKVFLYELAQEYNSAELHPTGCMSIKILIIAHLLYILKKMYYHENWKYK